MTCALNIQYVDLSQVLPCNRAGQNMQWPLSSGQTRFWGGENGNHHWIPYMVQMLDHFSAHCSNWSMWLCLLHLHSTFRILSDFQMSLYNFSFSCSGHFFILCQSIFLQGEPPPPRSTPWEAYRTAISYGAILLFYSAFQCSTHLHTHSWQIKVLWLGMFQQSAHVLLCAPVT